MPLDRDSLIEAEIPSLRRYARVLMRDRDRADDLVQDCLERAIARWGQWQQRGQLRAWLFAILHNLHANSARRFGRELAVRSEAVWPAEELTGVPQHDGLALRDLAWALGQLPAEQRQTVLLVGLEGFTYGEAAEIMSVPVGTVMSRLARGREKLRLLMDGERTPPLRRVK